MDLSNRTDLPATFDERAIVTQFLRYVRQTVHAKCVDLSPSDAAATPLPSSPAMSVAGLVSHLRWSEAFWIDVIFLGQPYQWPGTDDDSELQMRAGLERPLADLLEDYEGQAAHPTRWWRPTTGTQSRRSPTVRTASRSRCDTSPCTSSRRPPGTTVTWTSFASWPTASPAPDMGTMDAQASIEARHCTSHCKPFGWNHLLLVRRTLALLL